DPQNGANAGATYVFARSGTNWSQQAKLIGNDTAGGDLFGSSVTISGDAVAVGAPAKNYPTGSTNAGAAYVFVRNGTNWTQQGKLLAASGRAFDSFGSAV